MITKFIWQVLRIGSTYVVRVYGTKPNAPMNSENIILCEETRHANDSVTVCSGCDVVCTSKRFFFRLFLCNFWSSEDPSLSGNRLRGDRIVVSVSKNANVLSEAQPISQLFPETSRAVQEKGWERLVVRRDVIQRWQMHFYEHLNGADNANAGNVGQDSEDEENTSAPTLVEIMLQELNS